MSRPARAGSEVSVDKADSASCRIETVYGVSQLTVFSFGPNEQDNILCLSVPTEESRPLVRIQSACYTGEIFRSLDCDCHEQLDESMRRIHAGGGYFIYMLADGRGAGLLTKVRGLALGDNEGLDTYDAYVRLGVEPDPRKYARVLSVLQHIGLSKIELLTNNPRKIEALRDSGISVDRAPLQIDPTPASAQYLEAKRTKFGHLLDSSLIRGDIEGK
ncbi:GTP cyclohydrolase II [Salinibacterium soli]|uniref:GTP cyclohydrolase II n=1 Tax=Antiquaquibacter soli TaxID=3064523 RepID=UPI0034E39A62